MVFETPDGNQQALYASNGIAGGTSAGTDLLSHTFLRARCETSGSVTVMGTDGTRYEMTESDGSGNWLTKRIVDRNGNTATLTYELQPSGRKAIKSVTNHESRTINFFYSGGNLSSIQFGMRTWQYTVSGGNLTRVQPPTGGAWSFGYFSGAGATGYALQSVTQPQGGITTFSYQSVQFMPGGSAPAQIAVSSKSTSQGTWTYSYSPSTGGGYDMTTMSLPGSIGTVVYRHYGANTVNSGDVWKIGLLAEKETSGQGVQQTETFVWSSQTLSTEDNTRAGIAKLDTEIKRPLLTSRQIVRDGITYNTAYSNFDPTFGNPRQITEDGRTRILSYFDSSSAWIIGLVETDAISGVGTISSKSYGTTGNLDLEARFGATTGFNYHSDGALQRRQDPAGNATTYSGYAFGVPSTESRPEGVSISRSTDGFGNVTGESDGESTWGYTYDGLNRVTSVNHPVGTDTTITWTDTSKTVVRGGFTERTDFDSYGRTDSRTREGVVTELSHDVLGRKTFESLPGSSSGTTLTYDVLNRLKQSQSPAGPRTYSYGGSSPGNAYVTFTNERPRQTRFTYARYGDPDKGFLIGIDRGSGTAVTMSKDDAGILQRVTQGGVTRSFGYDSHMYLTSITEPEGNTTFVRDAAGNMKSKTNGGVTVTYGYDGLNRLETITHPDSAGTVTLTYDRRGKVKTVNNPFAVREYGYDANGNLILDKLTVDGRIYNVVLDYDSLDGLQSITYPDSRGTVQFGPDALGRPQQASPYITNVSYRPSGNVLGMTYGNGVGMSFGENGWQLPSTISAPTVALSRVYSYDGVGNMETIDAGSESAASRVLWYDDADRLTAAGGPWGTATSSIIDYDGSGNLQSQRFGSYQVDYGYQANKLTSLSGSVNRTFSYDARGNLASNGIATFGFNSANQLNCVNCTNATATDDVLYQYDGQGRRVWEEKAGKRTYFVQLPNGDTLYEYTPIGKVWTKHVYLHGKRIASETDSDAIVTSTAATASPSSSTYGQSISFQATVSPSGATGTVEFLTGSSVIGTGTLSNSQAAFATSTLSVGSHVLTVSYQGDANYRPSSTTVSVTVAKRGSTVALSASPNPSNPSQSIVLTANVSGSNPSGQVEFRRDGVYLGAMAASGGTATWNAGPHSAGTFGFTATYLGDANHNGSTSPAVNVTVDKQASTLSLVSSSPSSTLNQTVTFTASVSGSPYFTPTGSVVFKDGGTVLATQPLSGGTASYSTASLSGGTHTISAEYAGDGNHNSSSGFVTQVVSVNSLADILDHYYLSILGRAADAAGRQHWLGRIDWLKAQGADQQETLRVIAKLFYNGTEYAGRNRSRSEYLTDLYQTFYQRAPDSGGFAYWEDQMNQGITRDGVLFGFMFSQEFTNFMNSRLGVSSPPQRPEVALTMDIYRSAFARDPDDGGYLWMRDSLRNSQCSNTEAAEMRWFVDYAFTSPEYGARNRANIDYLTDLYDVFFRRNPDVSGFNFWLGQLNSGGMTRAVVRNHFFDSPEWGARVNLFTDPALCP